MVAPLILLRTALEVLDGFGKRRTRAESAGTLDRFELHGWADPPSTPPDEENEDQQLWQMLLSHDRIAVYFSDNGIRTRSVLMPLIPS